MRFFVLGLSMTILAAAAASCGGDGPGTGGAGGAGAASSSSSSSSASSSGSSSSSASSSSSSASSSSGSGSSSSGSAGGAGGGATSSSSGMSDAGAPAHGDCADDAECPAGACVAVTPGGFRVCTTPPEKATICASPLDQCCDNVPCPDNVPCYAGPLVPLCAGIPMEPHNQCATDQCTQDGDCPAGHICGPAGALGRLIRACLQAGCKVDGDCLAEPDGVCAPVAEPCCNTVSGLHCVYPSDGCRSSADCQSGDSCQVSGDRASCVPGAPLCPP